MRVANILEVKGSRVLTIDPDELIHKAAVMLRNAGVGALVVSRDGQKLNGILSERDIMRGFAEQAADLMALHVSDLMTSPVITCAATDSLSHVAQVMTTRRIRHLPVCDGDRLLGMVSIGDVLKHRVDEVQLEANVLRDVALAVR